MRIEFVQKGCNQLSTTKLTSISREILLTNNSKEAIKTILLIVKYNRTLPNANTILRKFWNIL